MDAMTRLLAACALIAISFAASSESVALKNVARPIGALPLSAPLGAELESVIIDDALQFRDEKVFVRVGKPFSVTSVWRPRSVGVTEFECFVEIEGSGPVIEQSLGTYSAPRDSEPVRRSASMEVPRFTHAGDGLLRLSIALDDGRRVAMGVWQIHVVPISTTSRYGEDRLADQFGPIAADTRASFRLGLNSRISVQLPAERHDARRLGIVSTLNYGDVDQGERVVSITPVYADGSSASPVFIEAGVHTALEHYDKLPPGTHRSKKIEVFESKDSGDVVDWRLKPYKQYIYAATIDLPIGADVERLEVRYLRDEGTIDIDAIVLLASESR